MTRQPFEPAIADSLPPSAEAPSPTCPERARPDADPAGQAPDPRPGLAQRRRALLDPTEPHAISGRVAACRRSSAAVFLDIHRGGSMSQACALRGSEAFEALRPARLGDWVELQGAWEATRSGDRALFAAQASFAARCEPGFTPWSEPMGEQAARERPDWARASDPERMRRTRGRMAAVSALRSWASAQGMEEAITPILSREPSGALAEPFWTRSRSLGDLALRVAPENALIRLLCSGIPALYEIGPSFRNEGVSNRHHPEFLMMEAYRQGWTAQDALAGCVGALRAAWSAMGAPDLPEVESMDIGQALVAFGCPPGREADGAWLAQRLAESGREPESDPLLVRWQALDELFEPPQRPVAVHGQPEATSPLAAPDPAEPGASLRFEVYLGGMEVANGYEQLRDPALQAQRFSAQASRAGAGREAMAQDARYMDAMALGMPRLAGFGLGIDRLAALAHGCSIREALPFALQGG